MTDNGQLVLIYNIKHYVHNRSACTPDEIIHLINGLDTSKSTGPDEISVRMLKPVATAVCEDLAPGKRKAIT